MYQEVDPKTTSRAWAYQNWIHSEMPMVTLFKTFHVKKLIKKSRKKGYKFNMLLCYCIAKAAADIPEMYLLPTKGKLLQYDEICISVIANTKTGGINFCDVPFIKDLDAFDKAYRENMTRVYETGEAYELKDRMCIGTSALPSGEIDGAVDQYNSSFTNPFLVWGKYRKRGFQYVLPISLRFHHVQMDGQHAVRFLNRLQEEIDCI